MVEHWVVLLGGGGWGLESWPELCSPDWAVLVEAREGRVVEKDLIGKVVGFGLSLLQGQRQQDFHDKEE